jgi:hypothetical protein
VTAFAFLSELEHDLDVVRFFGIAFGKGDVGFGSGESFLEPIQEPVRRRPVADVPVHFLAVPVDDELRGGRGDVEFLKDGVAGLVAAAGAVEDEILG